MNEFKSTSGMDVAVLPDIDHLELRVQALLSGRIRHLQLLMVDCGIVLRGAARTYHAKQLAQHAVMRMTEMPIRANEIEVA